jgi:uncharacterized protein YdaL
MKVSRRQSTVFVLLTLFLTTAGLLVGFADHGARKCVNVYYDKSPSPLYQDGKKLAVFLQKALDHFPDYSQHVSPIETYRRGDINSCVIGIYIGSYVDNKIPRAFLEDFLSTHQRVTWVGYNIWELGDRFEEHFGLKYLGMTFLKQAATTVAGVGASANANASASSGAKIYYKGRQLPKLIQKNDTFRAPAPQIELMAVDSSKFEMLAETRPEDSNELMPYIVQAKNRLYVADLPLSHAEDQDRSAVFMDILRHNVP